MTLIYFILVLGITVFIHEFGHFLFAKRADVYIYEFSIGMGPRIFKFNRKNDETIYSIRLFPIGGFVSMAGESIEPDENVPLEKHMYKKKWLDRFLIIIAGITFNFLLAIVLLFIIGMVSGVSLSKPIVDSIESDYPIALTSIAKGDRITKVNGKRINSTDRLLLELQVNAGKKVKFTLEDDNGNIKTEYVKPKLVKNGDEKTYKYGFSLNTTVEKGFIPSIKYAFTKTFSLIVQLVVTIGYLITGALSLNNLSGPVGIYNVVGKTAAAGFINLVYLVAFLCINVGFMNLLPIPAFDGGRLLFLIIEKIKGSPINTKVENIIHSVGFVLLMILMVVITYNDIIKLF